MPVVLSNSRIPVAPSGALFDYYIDPNGNDANPGTNVSPWALTAINTKRATYAGKRVGFRPGVYNVITILGGNYNTGSEYIAQFCIAGGDATHQTVLGASDANGYQVPTPGPTDAFTAIIDGGPANSTNNVNGTPPLGCFNSQASGSLGGVLQGYITVDGIEFRNCYNNSVDMSYANGASNPPALIKGIVVQNLYIHDSTNTIAAGNSTGIVCYCCDGAIVQNNKILRLADTQFRTTGIEFWTSRNCVARFNHIVSDGNGMTAGIFFKASSQFDNTIELNYIDMTLAGTNAAGCIVLDTDDVYALATIGSAGYCRARNNVLLGPTAVRWAAIDVGNYPINQNSQEFSNNTISGDSTGTGHPLFARYGESGTTSCWNQIVVNSVAGADIWWTNNTPLHPAQALQDYNCWPSAHFKNGLSTADGFSGNPPSPAVQYTSLASWAAALPAGCVGKEAHSIANDSPGFVGSGSYASFYKLSGGSPCSGTGSSDGTTGGTACDMGAWGGPIPPTKIGCTFA